MTQQEIEAISEKAQIIVKLNVSAFLKMIKERADFWIKELSNGN